MASQSIDQLLQPEVWTGLIGLHNKEYMTPTRILTRNINQFSSALSLGTTIPFPYNDLPTVRDRGSLGSEIDFEIGKGDKDILTINQNKIVTDLIPDEIRSNVTMPYINEKAQKIAQASLNAYEQALLAEIKTKAKMSLTSSAIDGTTIKKIFLDAIGAMNDAHLPSEDRFIILDSKSYLSILDWITTIPFQKSDGVIANGYIGEMFGLKIATSSFSDGIYFGQRNGLVSADAHLSTDLVHSIERSSTLIKNQHVYGLMALEEGKFLGKVLVGKGE